MAKQQESFIRGFCNYSNYVFNQKAIGQGEGTEMNTGEEPG